MRAQAAMRASEPLRVALVVGRFDPTVGGLESWTQDLAVALAALGHRIRVLTTEASVHPPGVSIDLVPASERPMEQARNSACVAARIGDHILHDT